MAKLTDWINESGKYEFCRSYGIPAEGEFVVRQDIIARDTPRHSKGLL